MSLAALTHDSTDGAAQMQAELELFANGIAARAALQSAGVLAAEDAGAADRQAVRRLVGAMRGAIPAMVCGDLAARLLLRCYAADDAANVADRGNVLATVIADGMHVFLEHAD